MLNVITLSVIMLSDIILNVVMPRDIFSNALILNLVMPIDIISNAIILMSLCRGSDAECRHAVVSLCQMLFCLMLRRLYEFL
jgi:hypothetical protein